MRINHKIFLFVATLLLALRAAASTPEAPPPGLAELSLEELLAVEVYSASKFVQKTTEVPASVTIVTAADIKRYGYRTLADMLKSVPGFHVTYDRTYHYVGVRGLGRPGDYNARVLLLLNGYRINDNIYDQAFIGTDFILDTDLIDRVEVIRGPGSSIYGGNALLGVINVITRDGRGLDGVEVSGEAASFRTSKGRASYGKRFDNGLDLLVSATAYNSDGQRLFFPEFDGPATNDGITDHTDYDDAHNLYASLGFGEWNLRFAHSERINGIPTGAFGTLFNDPANRFIDTRGYLSLRYERGFDERTSLTARWSGELKNDTQKASPDLKPETLRTYEVAWEQTLGFKRGRIVVSCGHFPKGGWSC